MKKQEIENSLIQFVIPVTIMFVVLAIVAWLYFGYQSNTKTVPDFCYDNRNFAYSDKVNINYLGSDFYRTCSVDGTVVQYIGYRYNEICDKGIRYYEVEIVCNGNKQIVKVPSVQLVYAVGS